MLFAGILGTLALASVLTRRSFLGVMVGLLLFFWSAALALIVAGGRTGLLHDGEVYAVFVTLLSVILFVIGLGGAVRLRYLLDEMSESKDQSGTGVENLGDLKH